jgi:protoporphyrinogen oxidase
MGKKGNIIIIGGNITGLYAAIKCLDIGYNVTIIEKRSLNVSNKNYNITYEFFNNNHKAIFILLKKLKLNYRLINNNTCDDKLNNIINNILDRSKYLPKNILSSLTFSNLCKKILSTNIIEELYKYIDNFDEIFNLISAEDAINIFTNELNNSLEYYTYNEGINELINRMIKYIIQKNGEIINNLNVNNITYKDKKFNIFTNKKIYNCDILISTISKKNLINFNFWNNEQKVYLNSVNNINSYTLNSLYKNYYWYNDDSNKDIIDKNNIENELNIRKTLLYNMHVVFPTIKNDINVYFWKTGINSVISRNKIINLYNNNFFICGESYNKNNIFLNYSLESIDDIIPRIIKKKFNYM